MMPHLRRLGTANRLGLWKTGTVGGVTRLGRPGTSAWPIEALTEADQDAFERLVAADPYVNVVVASRLAAYQTLNSVRLGGEILGIRDERSDELVAGAFNGGNLLPIGGASAHWQALADRLAERPRRGTSIVGRVEAVSTMWAQLEPVWGPARAVRAEQPLLMIGRGDVRTLPDQRVRVMRPQDVERYLPAAAAMFTEELGISPFEHSTGFAYRRRVESLLATGRAFGIVDEDGRMAFKADVGALSPQTCQLQGVWVRPDLRGRGLGTSALAGVLQFALRLAPTVSLYVNDFNTAARRMYGKLGMNQVATLSTVLF
jgi:predicted GNAT family acetyltransferase